MAVFTARPDEKAAAGVLVYQEAFGVNNHIKNICRRLAQEGYLAAAPELFHRTAPEGFEVAYDNFPGAKPHLEALAPESLMADIRATLEWVQGPEGTGTDNTACVGFCMGGMVAFATNATLPIKGAVSFYGSRILSQFMPLAKDQKAPVLLIWAGKDKSSPPDKVKQLGDDLRSAGKDFINAEFSEAEHGFNCDERSAFHPASAEVAWGMTLAFLGRHLGMTGREPSPNHI